MLHVRICAGGRPQGRSLPRPRQKESGIVSRLRPTTSKPLAPPFGPSRLGAPVAGFHPKNMQRTGNGAKRYLPRFPLARCNLILAATSTVWPSFQVASGKPVWR